MWELPNDSSKTDMDWDEIAGLSPCNPDKLLDILESVNLLSPEAAQVEDGDSCSLAARHVELSYQVYELDTQLKDVTRKLAASVQQLRMLYKELASAIETGDVMLAFRVTQELVKIGRKQGFLPKLQSNTTIIKGK